MTAEKFHDALTLLPADLIAEADQKRSGKPRRIHWKGFTAMAACFALVLWGSLGLFQLREHTEAAAAEAAVLQDSRGAARNAAPTEALAGSVEEEAAPEEQTPTAAGNGLCALPKAPARKENAAEETHAGIASHSGTFSTDAAAKDLYPGITQARVLEAIPAATAVCYTGSPAPALFRSRSELETYYDQCTRFQLDNLLESCKGYDNAWFEDHDLLLVTLCCIPASQTPEITAITEADGQWQFCVGYCLERIETTVKDWHILLETEKNLIGEEASITLVYE